jgi:hypothetical protein
MKLGELIDLRKVKQIQKGSVAAGKAPRLDLGVLGISIGQQQSTGDTSRVTEASLGTRIPYESHELWERSLPLNKTLQKDGKLERAQAFGKDFQGVAGVWDHEKKSGWIYEYYLMKSNILEARAKKVQKDYSPLGQLKELPQPIGINGGSYTYWVDVTKTPMTFVASDGSEIDEAKTLEDIAEWMDKWAAQIWLEFLDGQESLEMLRDENIIRLKKGRTDQQDHESNMR